MEYAQKIFVIHRRKALENGKNGTHFKNKQQVSLVCNQNPVLVSGTDTKVQFQYSYISRAETSFFRLFFLIIFSFFSKKPQFFPTFCLFPKVSAATKPGTAEAVKASCGCNPWQECAWSKGTVYRLLRTVRPWTLSPVHSLKVRFQTRTGPRHWPDLRSVCLLLQTDVSSVQRCKKVAWFFCKILIKFKKNYKCNQNAY